jgi:uncharacterized protein (TIGR02145 family)
MKQKQRIAFLGMAAVALILAACGSDSGNNSAESEGDSSSFGGKSSSSSSIEDGTLTYEKQTYKTVTIGTQTWMAENLNYADSVKSPNLKGSSWCYNNSADSCAKYGRLYTWAAVMGVASTYDSEILGDSVDHQGICPEGWHVPLSSEWTTLENYVGGPDNTGTYLKVTSGWYVDPYHDGNGTDAYDFSALPGGYYIGSGAFDRVGLNGHWWTATESNFTIAYYRNMDYGFTEVSADYYYKAYGRSLRCLKDAE